MLKRSNSPTNDVMFDVIHSRTSILDHWHPPNVRQVAALQKAQSDSAADASRREQLLQEEVSALRSVCMCVCVPSWVGLIRFGRKHIIVCGAVCMNQAAFMFLPLPTKWRCVHVGSMDVDGFHSL